MSQLSGLFTVNRVMFGLLLLVGVPASYVFFYVPVLGGWYLFGLTIVGSFIPVILGAIIYIQLVYFTPEDSSQLNLGGLIFLSLAIVMGVYFLLVTGNILFDTSEAQTHRVKVTDKYQLTTDIASFITGEPPTGKVRYAGEFVTVESWRTANATESFAVPEHVHSTLFLDEREEQLKIDVKSGALGVPWIADVQKMSSKPPVDQTNR